LLDGELPPDEIGLLMRRLERDPELRRTFGSYALIGETLRAPGGRVAAPDFASRVSAAIDAPAVPGDVAPVSAPRSTVQFWKRPTVRAALAASVAATAVLLIRPESVTQRVANDDSVEAPRYTMAASPTPAQAQRLASYMVAHSQYSTPMVRRNVLSGLLAADPGLTTVAYEMGEAR
jgi:negative regulator of sigma E activity